jgi:hypothetical protein
VTRGRINSFMQADSTKIISSLKLNVRIKVNFVLSDLEDDGTAKTPRDANDSSLLYTPRWFALI